jgi:DNA (cytosine-5)-methyltransferase 1
LQPGWIDHFGERINKYSKNAIERPIQTLSLFTGAGGLDIGFHDAGFNILKKVEIEEQFVATLGANCGPNKYLGESSVYCGDIHKYIPPGDLHIDFIIGGPPCQSFSAAGRRAAGVQGTDDERGTLFEEYVRLLKQLKPKGFLFENVYGITGAQNGKPWEEICHAFHNAGYEIYYRILDTADYGVPQHRERIFIVGMLSGEYKFPYPTHGPDSPGKLPHVTAREALEGVIISEMEKTAKVGGRYGYLLKDVPPGLNYSFFTEKMGHPSPIFAWRSKFSDFLYKADPDRPIRTLKAQGGQYTGPFHWESRPFSISELKRLQTFPDAYNIIGGRTIAAHQIGNSVPPQLARILALSILDEIFDIELPYKLPYMEKERVLGFRKRKRSLTEAYQAKAKAAIDSGFCCATNNVQGLKNHAYTASLSEDFTWSISPKGKHSLKVEFDVRNEEWIIRAMSLLAESNRSFLINITPAPKLLWTLPVSKIRLEGYGMTKEVFTGVWKALEEELNRLCIKADLVQLCGYYQYKSSLRCEMTFGENQAISEEWRILKPIVAGKGVGKILHVREVAQLWDVPLDSVKKYAIWLRWLGYEIRNHKTNPQILPEHLLIPYAFPTLNPLSVQLRKSLIDN